METPPSHETTQEQSQVMAKEPLNNSKTTENNLPQERKLVSRLQEAIDDRGRYSYRLKDLSIGYAAAKGCNELTAKEEINQIFKQQMGMGLQNYLDKHRLERGLSVDNSKGMGR